MTEKKPPVDSPTVRPARRLPPGVAEIEAGNPDDIFAPSPAVETPSPKPDEPEPGAADQPKRDGASAPATPGARRRGSFVAGERAVAKILPSSPTSRVGLGVAGLVLLVAIGGAAWWTLTPASDGGPQQTADTTTAPKPSTPGDTAKPTAPPASTDSAAVPPPESGKAPAPTDSGKAPEGKPDSGTSAGAPTTPPAPTAGPPLAPRTGPITEEPLDVLKRRAAAGETDSMEELARRYVEGVGIAADGAEGAKWLLRAAELGAPGAMFNVAVMYERGIVLDKDPARAIDWYTKASTSGVPMATHNMALMYREGAGIAPDYKRAHELLLAAARSGMSASMFALANMYEAGSHGLKKDLVQAIVWYAMTLHFQRASPSTQDSEMARKADQKVNELQRILSTPDLDRAQAFGEKEHSRIIDTIRAANKLPPSGRDTPSNDNPPPPTPGASAPKADSPPPSSQPVTPGNPTTQTVPPAGAPTPGKPPAGPQTAAKSDPKTPATTPPPAAKPMGRKEQLTEIQKMLITLHYYRGKADGVLGNDTRAAIKKVQASAGLPQTGEPSQELIDVLRDLIETASRK